MKKKLWIVAILLFSIGKTFAQQQGKIYQYFVDLNVVEEDRIKVELVCPKLKGSKATFYMPKIVPGTYSIYNFGRFVSNLQAFDNLGNLLAVKRVDVNTWEINNAKKLYKISYWVDDTYDDVKDNPVAGMSGTNIEANENFVLNTHGVFGYFKGLKRIPFQVDFKRPLDFYGSTSLIGKNIKADTDRFQTSTYNELVDSPIMYCKPDTAIVQVANTEVLVSVYSPGKLVKAKYLAENYQKLLLAQKDYLGGVLPVDKYAFINYFDPTPDPVNGALEHNKSSMYYLPDFPQEQMIPFLMDIAAHEFMHILTPLNIHSKEIHYFDFNKPKMSQHLWLYEGITEYFAGHVQVTAGIKTLEQYTGEMLTKIQNSQRQFNPRLAFTQLSKKSLGEHADQYGNVYEKGALIGWCLDIKLRQLSAGKYGVIELLQDLAKKYGQDKPFKDKKLFKEIKKLTYPEIGDFFKTYVDGSTPLPYNEILNLIGLEYIAPEEYMGFSLGNIRMGFNQETGRLVIASTAQMNTFGKELNYQTGDEIGTINGESLTPFNARTKIDEIKEKMKEGDPFEVMVYRPDSKGEYKEVTLKAVTKKVPLTRQAGLKIKENATEAQLALRKAWLRK